MDGMTSAIANVRRGPLRAVAHMVATPLVPRDFLDLIDPLGSTRDLRGRIDAVTPETADAVTVRIRVGRGWRGRLAGQYVRLGIDIDGVRQWRTYSLTSPVSDTRHLTITVKTIDGGIVSNHLATQAGPGTVVHLDQAAGDFIVARPHVGKALFVTAGSGITPVMGMLRSQLTAKTLGPRATLPISCAPRASPCRPSAAARAARSPSPRAGPPPIPQPRQHFWKPARTPAC